MSFMIFFFPLYISREHISLLSSSPHVMSNIKESKTKKSPVKQLKPQNPKQHMKSLSSSQIESVIFRRKSLILGSNNTYKERFV